MINWIDKFRTVVWFLEKAAYAHDSRALAEAKKDFEELVAELEASGDMPKTVIPESPRRGRPKKLPEKLQIDDGSF
jgi:hypothetical protein